MSWILDTVRYSLRRGQNGGQNGKPVHVHTEPSGRKSISVSEVRNSKSFRHLVTAVEEVKRSGETGGRIKIKEQPSEHLAKMRRAYRHVGRLERTSSPRHSG